jgi:hypothetical protein
MNKLRRMRWARKVACMGEKWSAYRILVGKPERKKPLNLDTGGIILNRSDRGWCGMNLIDLAQDRG